MALLLLIVVVFLGTITLMYVINGYALMYLWKWFMVPLGLPAISISWAIGIAIVIGLLTNHNEPKKDEELDSEKVLLNVFLRPLFALLIGYIVKLFMN